MFFVDDIAAISVAVSGVKKAVGGLGGGTTASQKRRDAEIQTDYAKAVGGDVATAMSILDGRFNSVAYSKALCEKAWSMLLVENPQVATAALEGYKQRDPANTSPGVMAQLGAEWNNLVNKIKKDVGTTVQNVGSGITTGAATKIDPNTGRVTLPLSSSMIWTVALVALALAAVFFLSKKRA